MTARRAYPVGPARPRGPVRIGPPENTLFFCLSFFRPLFPVFFSLLLLTKLRRRQEGVAVRNVRFFVPRPYFFFIIILEPILPDILLLHNPGPFRKVKFRFVFYFIKYCFLRPLPRLPRPSVKNFARFLFPPLPSPPRKNIRYAVVCTR